jgi:hypothetical protein
VFYARPFACVSVLARRHFVGWARAMLSRRIAAIKCYELALECANPIRSTRASAFDYANGVTCLRREVASMSAGFESKTTASLFSRRTRCSLTATSLVMVAR